MNKQTRSIDAMTVTSEKKVLGQKPVPVPLCPKQIPQLTGRGSSPASVARSRHINVEAMVRPSLDARNQYVYKYCLHL